MFSLNDNKDPQWLSFHFHIILSFTGCLFTTDCHKLLLRKDAFIAEWCSLDIEDWNPHKCSITTHFNVCLLGLLYFIFFFWFSMYLRQREVCFSSGRHATNLAETTDGVGWVDYLFFRLVVAIGMQHITCMFIKIVKGKGSEHTKA